MAALSPDISLLASTFATVFLAELGDKTQLAIVTISGTSPRPGAVFAGSSLALVLASLLGAAAGGSLSAVIPTNALQLAAAAGFLVIGIRLIVKAGGETAAAEGASGEPPAVDS
jgi:putative Ca2+/H+ antiporter (TMEM165/GDT1 family)